MSKFRRSIFFWTLVVLFLITAPIIVLHARGYRFDFTRGVFVYSGSINIKSSPQNINVSLNGKLNESKKLDRINNSYNIAGLLPGDYKIKITSPDFQTWSKKTDVHSGLASEFWNVVLARNNYEKTDYTASGITKFFTSPGNKYMAIAEQQENTLSIKNLNIKNKAIENIFSFPNYTLIPDSEKENIEWSPVKNNRISIPTKKIPAEDKNKKIISEDGNSLTTNYIIADISANTFFSLNDFLNMPDIKDVRWDPQSEDYLFFLSKNSLYRANIRDKKDIVLISEDVSSFDLSKTSVFYSMLSNKIIYKKLLDAKSEKIQATNVFPEDSGDFIKKMIVYDDSRIAFLDNNDSLFLFNQGDHDTYFKQIGEKVFGLHFSDDGKKLLFWTENEISVYYLRDWNVQPVRLEDELTEITRYIEPVKNVQWFKDYEHILFNVGNYTKFLELDPRDHRNSMDLVKTGSLNPFIIYNSYLGKLFFTDEKDSQNNLYSIDFPEKTTILNALGF